MDKVFVNKNEIMEKCGYSEDEFIEYFGDKCVGLISYEEVDEVFCEISVLFDGGEFYYEYNLGGCIYRKFNSLKEVESWFEIY